MKALIRDKGETVTEEDGVPCIDWSTGYPLTNPKWFGGPYALVQNYVPPVDDAPAQYEEVIVEDPEPIPQEVNVPQEEDVAENDDYVVINGVRYTKEELRKLIE